MKESKEKPVTMKNAKAVYSQSMGTTEHITLLCGGRAAGAALPPRIIYPKAYPGGHYKFGGPDDALYAWSGIRMGGLGTVFSLDEKSISEVR